MAFPKIGNLAPLFSLPNQDGRIISLKDFRDRKTVVLYFYPAAMTPGCTTQACGCVTAPPSSQSSMRWCSE